MDTTHAQEEEQVEEVTKVAAEEVAEASPVETPAGTKPKPDQSSREKQLA